LTLLDIRDANDAQREQAAHILVSALEHAPSAWKTQADAREEVALFMSDDDRVALLAIADGAVIGWIGAIRQSAFAWEMHPLVVSPDRLRQGIGTLLVHALEARARAEGVITIWLGTDDDFGGTSLFGRDLYPDVLAALSRISVATGHPYAFYERLGYTVTGVFPDVDGVGRHDILMARRIAPSN
jgi:aminoglycoside 6'-N-acetyltransferase I